jgi:hypothetical protein
VRPIDKYYRWYYEDEANNIAPDRCRGLNHDQYRIADRLYTLFMRTHRSPGQQWEPRVDQSSASDEAIHRVLQAVHDYRTLMDRVNAESQRILEHFSLKLPLRSLAPLRIVKASVIALKKRATGTFFRRQFCCVCHSVVAYEEQRGWRKGYAIIRLREALDEMNEGRRKR